MQELTNYAGLVKKVAELSFNKRMAPQKKAAMMTANIRVARASLSMILNFSS